MATPLMKARFTIEYGDRFHEAYVDEPADPMLFIGMSDQEIVQALAAALVVKMVEEIKADQARCAAKE